MAPSALRVSFRMHRLPCLEQRRGKRRCGPNRGVIAQLSIADDLALFDPFVSAIGIEVRQHSKRSAEDRSAGAAGFGVNEGKKG